MPYDYYKHVAEDAINYVKENYEPEDKLPQDLFYDLEDDDSVTGNNSGSYTMSRYQAEQDLKGNYSIIIKSIYFLQQNRHDADEDFDNSPEMVDVIVRCYALDHMFDYIKEALEKIGYDFTPIDYIYD